VAASIVRPRSSTSPAANAGPAASCSSSPTRTAARAYREKSR
jgi:hypothetical protein